jgi:hypothetical protein
MVDRFNVPVTRRGPFERSALSPSSYDELLLCVRTIPDFRGSLEQHSQVPWILGAPIMPKVLARADGISAVSAGGHSVEQAGNQLRHLKPPDVLIAHVPFSTFERFRTKSRQYLRNYPRLS